MRAEEDGKELRRQLMKNLRAAAGPARQAARQSIRSITSRRQHAGQAITSAIAQKIQVVAKTSGPAVGARIVARETPNARGFRHAPRRFNSAAGWSHPVFDSGTDVHQVGKPGWFDEPIAARKPEYRRAVLDAIDATATRISRRI
ncbi:hypothetical protein [Amycolatopsis thermoflava]|uniref:hypothetical protein n=1 Tax=Amycolatopsis thermoflava TaxID=84480 RepID=UPI0038204DD5